MENVDENQKVYDKAIKLVSLRMHTTFELRRKLLLRKYDKNSIDDAISRLTDLKLVDDERFAEIFLDNLIRFKTFGYYGLKMKLLQRGIEGSMIERLLAETLSIDQEVTIAKKLMSRKSLEREKMIHTLKRKGFRSEAINKALTE